MNEFLKKIGDFLGATGLTVVKIVAVIIVGVIVIKLAKRFTKRLLSKTKTEKAIIMFLSSLLNAFLYFILFYIVFSIAGISTTGFIALFSAVGLAISLAMQDSLSNLANGFIIIGTKPFVVGDYVEINAISGTVKEIRMFTTKLTTPDNKTITIPNKQVINANVINYSSCETRRLDLTFSVAYGSNVEEVKAVMRDVVESHKNILEDPATIIRMSAQSPNSLDFAVKAWVKTGEYWNTYFDINEEMYERFNKENIIIPFPQMDVHIKNGENK